MNTANAKNSSARLARRVTVAEGVPQNCHQFWGRKATGRTPAGEPNKDPIRGYSKISGAASAFNFDFKNKVVLDIGSSTGGFTEYALNHGAKKVIAVEKGSHQMKAPLRFDSRIELHEKTDIFDVTRHALPLEEVQSKASRTSAAHGNLSSRKGQVVELNLAPEVIVADVSFISLTKILKHAKDNLADQKTDFLVMLKPQFEAAPEQLVRGVVKNDSLRRKIIKDFEFWLKNNGFIVINKHDNDLKGRTGNRERFYHLKLAKKLA